MVAAPKLFLTSFTCQFLLLKRLLQSLTESNRSYPLQALHATKMLVHKIRLWKVFFRTCWRNQRWKKPNEQIGSMFTFTNGAAKLMNQFIISGESWARTLIRAHNDAIKPLLNMQHVQSYCGVALSRLRLQECWHLSQIPASLSSFPSSFLLCPAAFPSSVYLFLWQTAHRLNWQLSFGVWSK